MKLAVSCAVMCFSTMANAQAFQPPQSYTPYSDPFRGIDPDRDVLRGRGWGGDTPTMRQQREKRVAAFRVKVANLVTLRSGTLSDADQETLRHEYTKLLYRNR